MSQRTTPVRFIRTAGAIAAGVLLFGCTSVPMSADAAFGGSPTPASAMMASGGGNAGGGNDGVYAGSANVEVNGNNRCHPSMSITNFEVSGNAVKFGGFRAPVSADGNLQQIYYRGMLLSGRFDDGKFSGHVDATGDTSSLLSGCVFAINVTRQAG